jgi:hypothetical protein
VQYFCSTRKCTKKDTEIKSCEMMMMMMMIKVV